ncbi:MAG TPA: indolepyruvate oxidoreductase subunit beta [Clostridia bacterium]|jgi:indolepyruvate ferredoxin oxidoreductase beta subunit|nr:indolepyruvate oxidoreductase subunit beta [Clostridia bacterium]
MSKNSYKTNILIVGVGGQGSLLASKILGSIANIMGYDCKLSEVHGMSQRGGSVVTHVRIDDEVISPIITPGEADYIIAFEMLEALRWAYYLKQDGVIIVNEQKILPMPVIMGKEKYPSDVLNDLRSKNINVCEINGLQLAHDAGGSKSVNVVLIGVFCALNNIPFDVAKDALYLCVKKQFLDMNVKALKFGYESVCKAQ